MESNQGGIIPSVHSQICMDPLTSSSNAQQKDSPMDDILPMNTSSSSTPSSSLTSSSLSSSSSSHEEGDNLKNDRHRKKRQMFDEDGQQQMWSVPRYSFTSTERSQAMSVVAVGALLANFPVVVLINWHGPFPPESNLPHNPSPPFPPLRPSHSLCFVRHCGCRRHGCHPILSQSRILLVQISCIYPSI
jgi:hypothetical protein